MVNIHMIAPQLPIFREEAVRNYFQKREQRSRLRFYFWPIVACFWVLLSLFLIIGGLAYSTDIPEYTPGAGVILGKETANQLETDSAVAVIFVAPKYAKQLKPGQAVRVTLGISNTDIETSIKQVEPGLVDPRTVAQRYRLTARPYLPLTQPAAAVLVELPNLEPGAFTGSLLKARVTVGKESIYSFLVNKLKDL
ncbi:hypothetical protein EI42_02861 [Thermosporothrix hazakensis]|uniref:HlyD family secretion protein n=2 Tax=Thermosporothrix hazakensis TaxID=644383 RepID=A0A326U8N9_THEHA|nr:hypothetical protein EI42_02861 [Thermosporothrix hazakensis]GCE45721.1 hypothetical protein KTH_05900 [Thermosporothrix hazakensis]